MGREVRMVPPDWQHPKKPDGNYIPMLDQGFEDAVHQWETEDLPEYLEGERLWAEGKVKRYGGEMETTADVIARSRENQIKEPWRTVPENPDYEWWAGDAPSRPKRKHYMPQWPDVERTHFMMYEDTSEGTPISPAFATAEELARWLADTGASAFAGDTATYDQWLNVIQRGLSTISAVLVGGRMMSGVEFEGSQSPQEGETP